MSNKIIIPSRLKYKSAPSVDQRMQISLDSTTKQITEYDKNITVSVSQVFDDERQESVTFRPTFQINFLYENKYVGTTNYKPFQYNLLYYKPEDSIFSGVWFGYPQFYEFDILRPNVNDGHFTYNSKSAFTYNWTYYITYPFENDYTKKLYTELSNSPFFWVASDGIPFEINNIQINGNELISFKCVAPHGLMVGESVELKMANFSGYNGNFIFEVFSLGDGLSNTDDSIFNVYNIGYTGTTFATGKQGTFKRVKYPDIIEESRSKYYVRRNKVILGIDDLIMTRTGFQNNPFKDVKELCLSSLTPNQITRIAKKTNNYSYTLSTKNDLILDGVVDNQKRPVSEIFLTFMNKGYSGYFNKPFINNVGLKQGWSFNISNTNNSYWDDNQVLSNSQVSVSSYSLTDNTGVSKIFYYNNNLSVGDTMDGDFCEWNDYDQTERVISNYYHKIKYNQDNFNTQNIPTSNPDGYYYKVHHSMQLRVFSNFLESGSVDSVDNVPYYSFYSSADQEFRWRDLYQYGFIDEENRGVDYPFLNGTHYPFSENIIRVIPEGSTINDTITVPIKPVVDGCE